MAIDYHLEIGTDYTLDDVTHELVDAAIQMNILPPDTTTADMTPPGRKTPEFMSITLNFVKPGYDQNLSREQLGYIPTVRVSFRFNMSGDYAQQDDDMIRVTVALLDRVPGDFTLIFQDYPVWLRRINGEITVNDDPETWPPHRLALINQPYRRTDYADFDY